MLLKKLLCLVLALAMVISCVSMVNITANSSSANVAVKLTANKDLTGTTHYTRVKAGFTAADVKDGKIIKTYTIVNPNDHEIVVKTEYQDGWDSLSKMKGTDLSAVKRLTIPANSAMPFGVKLLVNDDNTISYKKGSEDKVAQLANVYLRVDLESTGYLNNGEAFYVLCDADDAAHGLTSGGNPAFFGISSVTSVPAVAKKAVVNGDAENGKTGWTTLNGGSIENVADPDNASNKVMKFNPGTGKWATPAFNIGAVILKNAEYGYMGGGAGEYKVTFRAKAEAGKKGGFSFVLNSANHQEKDKIAAEIGYTPEVGSYKSYSATPIEITDTWQTFEIKFTVDQAWLDMIKDLFESAHAKAETTYDLMFRLDGSKLAYKDSEFFGYYNTSDVNFNITLSTQVTHKKADGNNTWADVGKAASGIAAAGKKVTLTYTFDVENGMVKVTNGGATALYALDQIFLRINAKALGANEAGKTLIIGAEKGDIAYKIGSAYKGTLSFVKELPEMEETTPADFAPKKENMNAEKGLVNWGTIHGGKITHVTPGAAGTGHAVRFDATGKYNSIAFDLGPWIIYDAKNGYKGGGAGKYEVTFYAKADKVGKFNVMLNPQLHLDQKGVAKEIGSNAAVGSTWTGGQPVELTKGWKKYTVTLDLKYEWYAMMLKLYKSNHPNAALAYQLALRFDGASQAFKDKTYGYWVDQISIKKVASYTNEVPVGIEIEATEDHTASAYFITKSGYVTKNDVKDGVLTKKITFKNTGTEDLMVQFELQATVKNSEGKDTWASAQAGEWVEVAAGETVELIYEVDVNEDGTVTILDTDVKLEKLFARFNLKTGDGNYEFVKGTKFQIRGTNTNEYKLLAKLSSSSAKNWTITPIYEKSTKSESGDMLPVAMIATAMLATTALVVVAKKRKED